MLAAACGCAAGSEAQISFDSGRFILRGATLPPDQWREGFVVTVAGNSTPIWGVYRADSRGLVFEPRFPVQPGLKYEASFRGDPPVRTVIEIPAVRTTPPHVAAIYPTTNQIPENQLKLYVHFSAPMSRGEAYSRIRLLDETGLAVELPFLEIDQELWDVTGRRLTLLFDPGRIKRGLIPHEDVGPPLRPARRYTLTIDAGWPDSAGTPSESACRKEFTVVAADREPPDPSRWKVVAPQAGTREPLEIRFQEPMDHALAAFLLAVEGVQGQVRIEAAETLWRFTPDQPWTAGRHFLTVDTALEDLAGNRIGRAFDVDFGDKSQREARREIRRIPFRVP